MNKRLCAWKKSQNDILLYFESGKYFMQMHCFGSAVSRIPEGSIQYLIFAKEKKIYIFMKAHI
jgi:hypothetical protein